MEDPDDPVLQDECARRLFAYAAELRAERQRPSSQPGTFEAPLNEGANDSDWDGFDDRMSRAE